MSWLDSMFQGLTSVQIGQSGSGPAQQVHTQILAEQIRRRLETNIGSIGQESVVIPRPDWENYRVVDRVAGSPLPVLPQMSPEHFDTHEYQWGVDHGRTIQPVSEDTQWYLRTDTATGQALDSIGSFYGLERHQGSTIMPGDPGFDPRDPQVRTRPPETDAEFRTRLANVVAGPPPSARASVVNFYDEIELTIGGQKFGINDLGIKPKKKKPEPPKYKKKSIYEHMREMKASDFNPYDED